MPLETRHDEFTVEIPENQILRTTMERMLRLPRVDGESAWMLRRLLRDFADVTPLRRGGAALAWPPSRNEVPARHEVRQASTEIVCHVLDLNRAPSTILAGVSDLARQIAVSGGARRE